MTNDDFRILALSFGNSEEKPHFDRQAFCLIGGRIFATLHEPTESANLRLPLALQSALCESDEHIYRVNSKWGLQGWTTFELESVPHKLICSALEVAYYYAKDK